MSDPRALARAAFAGCAAAVGPLIGIELEVGQASIEPSDRPPEAASAVLPLAVESGGKELAVLELTAPLDELAALARRMLGNEEPDAKRELGAEDAEAIGEILGVMGAAVGGALREQLDPGLELRALAWWRSDEPGQAAFGAGARLAAGGSLVIPGGPSTALLLRIPPGLFEVPRSSASTPGAGTFLLLDIEAETAEPLARALGAAQLEVQKLESGDAELAALWPQVAAVIVSAGGGLELARRLRTSSETWRLPVLVCIREPTREQVVAAMASGASHVLVLPAEDAEVVRVLALAQARPA